MKYSALKTVKSNRYEVPSLNGGIDTSKYCELIDDNCFSQCKNIWNKNGVLTNRLGLLPNEQGVISIEEVEYNHFVHGFEVTDTLLYVDGEPKKIGYCVEGDGDSYERFRPYFVNSDGSLTEMGYIGFNRVSYQTFNRFEKVFFVVADATAGSGIYAFLTRCNRENFQCEYVYDIYEASNDYSSWQKMNESNFYIPTVYMNGRGNSFRIDTEDPTTYTEEPKELEAFNMLTGKFKAYYTTDGWSSVFDLPFNSLDSSNIRCRIYSTAQSYTDFIVDAYSDTATATVLSYSVTLKVDRSLGRFSFFYNNNPFAVPRMLSYGGNNMEISASRTVDNGIPKTIGAKGSILFGNNIYFYGNKIRGNEVYTATISRPLYVSAKCKVALGEPTSSITAMAVVCNKLVAFKNSEIYRITLSRGSTYQVSGLLTDISRTMLNGDTLSSEAVHLQVGCDCPNTLKVCANRIVWTRSDGSVYTLATTTYGKENNIYKISSALSGLTEGIDEDDFKNAYACDLDGYYLLYVGNKVFVADYRIKDFGFPAKYSGQKDNGSNISWYIWEFPQALQTSSIISLNKTALLSCYDSLSDVWYISALKGDKDYLLHYVEEETQLECIDIESSFKTGYYDFGRPYTHKTVKNVYITECSGSKAEICLDNTPDGICYTKIMNLPLLPDVLKTNMILSDAKKVSVSFRTVAPFRLGGLIFEYLSKAV